MQLLSGVKDTAAVIGRFSFSCRNSEVRSRVVILAVGPETTCFQLRHTKASRAQIIRIAAVAEILEDYVSRGLVFLARDGVGLLPESWYKLLC